jgi:hypothetical protein
MLEPVRAVDTIDREAYVALSLVYSTVSVAFMPFFSCSGSEQNSV